MEQSELFSRLGVALAIGLLVGLERGWSKREEEDRNRAAGLRTFALSGLLGGVSGLLAERTDGVFLGMAFVAFAAAFAAFHWLEAQTDNDVSATSVIAGMLTFLLGALAVLGDIGVAVAGAVAMTGLLAFREQLHRWVATLSWAEINSVLILLAMSFLLLPLLPNRTIDPWGAINPYEVWLLTILIAAVSFVGYVAVKVFGDRMGIMLAAVAGGLASSTATTLAFARLGRHHTASAQLLSAGILVAGLVMMGRVAAVTLLLNAALAGRVVLPLVAAGVVLAFGALLLARGKHEAGPPLPAIANPLAIGTALKLGGIIVVVMLTAGFLRSAIGASGVLLVAAISGIFDADAITISMARQAGSGLAIEIAAQAILVGVTVNTLTKTMMAATTGGKAIGVPVAITSAAALAAGCVTLVLTS